MRILLLVVASVFLGCVEASETQSHADAAADNHSASGEQRATEPVPDTPAETGPSASKLVDEIVPERLTGPDPVAVAIVKQPIYRYAAKTVTFSPDGRWLAIGYGDGQVQLFDVQAASTVRNWFAHNNWAFDLQFSSDSQSLWTGGGDNRVRQWDVATGKLLQRFEDHTDDVHGVAVTQDGGRLVSGADDHLVVIRDVSTGDTRTLEGHTAQVTAVTLDAADTRIASASRDETVRLWDLETGESLHELRGHEGDVMCVSFSHDGQRLLTGSNDRSCRVWNVETGELEQTIEGHEKPVYTAIWLPGDEVIATGSADGRLRLIRVEDGETIVTEDLGANVADVAISPDGDTLAVAVSNGTVHLFSTDGATLVQTVVIPPISAPQAELPAEPESP